MSSTSNNATTSEPSSILFFIAVAIGVLIACVFIFFSMRYYVRTRLGVYATARITTSNNNGVVLLAGDFPLQGLNNFNPELTPHRRLRRRRRFTKKKRLTEDEVNHLFPVRTYQNWLDGGAERDIEGRDIHEELKEESDEDLLRNTEETSETPNDKSKVQVSSEEAGDQNNDESPSEAKEIDSSPENVDLGSPFHEEIHFDSGTCAICIDTFEPEDQVRGLICGHVFHQECLDPWLIKRKACCPMCKRDYYLKKTNENGEPEEDQGDTNSFDDFNTELHYTTLNERVAEILARDPSVEERAKVSIQKYLGVVWRFFWFVMGVSRADLINSAIVEEYERSRVGHSENEATESDVNAGNNTENQETSDNQETNGHENNNNNNETTEESRERVERLA